MGDPVSGDVDTPAYPDLLMTAHIVEKACQCRGTPGAPDQPAVQSHRHHSRLSFALRIEHVEAVFQVLVELLARVEPLGAGKGLAAGNTSVGSTSMCGKIFSSLQQRRLCVSLLGMNLDTGPTIPRSV